MGAGGPPGPRGTPRGMGEPFGLRVGPSRDGRHLLVLEVPPGSPAAASGVQPGWRLLAAFDSERRFEIPVRAFAGGRGAPPLPAKVDCVFQDGRGRELRVRLAAARRAASPDSRRAARDRQPAQLPGADRSRGERQGPRRSRSAGGGERRSGPSSSAGVQRLHPAGGSPNREPPRRFSASPARSGPESSPGAAWGLPFRSTSASPPRAGWLGAIASLFKRPIEPIEPGSHEAKVASGRAWRGWKAVCRDGAIIMRKEYPSECAERFRRLRRQLQEKLLAGVMVRWEHVVGNRRAELRCSVRILRLSTQDRQRTAFSEWAWVTKNGARPQASSPAVRSEGSTPQKGDASSSVPASSIHQPATLLPIEITSSTRSPSSSPKRLGSWFFGLFGQSPSAPQADAKFLQEPELVSAPRPPDHVLAMWPDLDLDSYVVRKPSEMVSSLNCARGANSQELGLDKLRNDLQQMEQLKTLLLTSRERVQRLASRPGLRWLKKTRDCVIITDVNMAKSLLGLHDFNASRALAAFTVDYVGAASARKAHMQHRQRVFRAWHIHLLRKRLRLATLEQMRRTGLLKLKGRILQAWRQQSGNSRSLLNIAAVIWLKRTRSRLRSVLEHWKDAAQKKLESDDDGLMAPVGNATPADGFSQLVEFSTNAGRAVLGERGVAAGINLASALGGFLIGPSRLQSVLASISPPSSPPRAEQPSQQRRAASISPPRAWPTLAPQPRPRAMTLSPPPRGGPAFPQRGGSGNLNAKFGNR